MVKKNYTHLFRINVYSLLIVSFSFISGHKLPDILHSDKNNNADVFNDEAKLPQYSVSIFAGSEISGNKDGENSLATFKNPSALIMDKNHIIYIADSGNNKIRTVSPEGIVNTLAGNGSEGSKNGNSINSSFRNPSGLAIDVNGNIYVSDTGNHIIRKIYPNGLVKTFAGSKKPGNNDAIGVKASFNTPMGMAFNSKGYLFIADMDNNKIRTISPQGIVTTFAGSGYAGSEDGIGITSSFNKPISLVIDVDDNLYVADYVGGNIRNISTSGYVTTLILNRNAIQFPWNHPRGIALDSIGSLYMLDDVNKNILKINLWDLTDIDTDIYNSGFYSFFSRPSGMMIGKDGIIYVSDHNNIVKINKY